MGSRPCERGSKNTVEMIGGILVHGHGVCMRLCTKMVLLKGMLNGKRERAGERRAAPTGNTSRRERRDEAAGTLSRVLGARTGASESGSLSCQKRGRAVARDKGGEWAAADASRDLLDGSGCTCERE